jgi:hypothetical protein
VQRTLNSYWAAVQPNAAMRERLSRAEIVVLAVGALLVTQLVVGLSQLPAPG